MWDADLSAKAVDPMSASEYAAVEELRRASCSLPKLPALLRPSVCPTSGWTAVSHCVRGLLNFRAHTQW